MSKTEFLQRIKKYCNNPKKHGHIVDNVVACPALLDFLNVAGRAARPQLEEVPCWTPDQLKVSPGGGGEGGGNIGTQRVFPISSQLKDPSLYTVPKII